MGKHWRETIKKVECEDPKHDNVVYIASAEIEGYDEMYGEDADGHRGELRSYIDIISLYDIRRETYQEDGTLTVTQIDDEDLPDHMHTIMGEIACEMGGERDE